MPKQKTHSGAKKRFKVTGTGKILRRRRDAEPPPGAKAPKRKRGVRQANGRAKRRQARLQEAAGEELGDATRQAIRPRAQEAPQGPRAGEGYWGLEQPSYTHAKEQVEHSLVYAYRDRKTKSARSGGSGSCASTRRAAARALVQPVHRRAPQGGIELDRKVLADLAVSDPAAFGKLAEQAKAALAQPNAAA